MAGEAERPTGGVQRGKLRRSLIGLVLVVAVAVLSFSGFQSFAPLVALEGALTDRLSAAARPPA